MIAILKTLARSKSKQKEFFPFNVKKIWVNKVECLNDELFCSCWTKEEQCELMKLASFWFNFINFSYFCSVFIVCKWKCQKFKLNNKFPQFFWIALNWLEYWSNFIWMQMMMIVLRKAMSNDFPQKNKNVFY